MNHDDPSVGEQILAPRDVEPLIADPDVVEAVRSNNKNVGGQFLVIGAEEYLVRGLGLLQTLDDIRDVPLKVVSGTAVRIADVADVVYGNEIRRGVVSLDGEREVVSGMVLKLYGENTSEVIDRLYEKVADVQKALPDGVELVPYYEQAKLVEQATGTVKNALMIGALAHAGKHLDEPRYTAAAVKAADFILKTMRKKGRLLRTYRTGGAKLNAYLEDYAFLADALLDLHETTGRKRWLDEAGNLVDTMIQFHKDPAGGGFFFTSSDHEKLLNRVKDPTDQAVPSGNAVAADVLIRLGALSGKRRYTDLGTETLKGFQGLLVRSPRGMNRMFSAVGRYLDVVRPSAAAKGPRPDASAGSQRVAVDLFASRVTAAPGATIDLAVRLTIDAGWHVNSHAPSDKNLVATSLAQSLNGLGTLSPVTYPKPRTVTLPFSTEAMSVYEGTVWIRAAFTLKPDARAGTVIIPLMLESQACSDTECLEPRTHRLGLTVTIDPKVKAAKPRHPSVFGAK